MFKRFFQRLPFHTGIILLLLVSAFGQQVYEYPCPASTNPLASRTVQNPATGKWRAYSCIDASGKLFDQTDNYPRPQAKQWAIWMPDYGITSGAMTAANSREIGSRAIFSGTAGLVFTAIAGISRPLASDPSFLNMATGTGANSEAFISPLNNVPDLGMTSGLGLRTRVQLVTAAPPGRVFLGWTQATASAGAFGFSATPANFIGFRMSETDANWFAYLGNGGFATTIDSGVVRDTLSHDFWIEFDNQFYYYYIDAKLIGKISATDVAAPSIIGVGNLFQDVVWISDLATGAARNLRVAFIYHDLTVN